MGDRDLQHADGIALKTLEILQYFQPEILWIENPRGGMLKDRSFMKDIPYIDVDYCQFADWGYQKLPDYVVAKEFQNCHTKFVTKRHAETSL